MNNITKSMARLNISSEMLESINTTRILESFRHDFKKLGDFKKAREKHESRSALSRWWNSNELKDAQLDSIELQESFSQKLGQLMVISVAMSQQLNDQQQSLGEQQASLQKQTDNISDANKKIYEQQQELTEQQGKLKKLINEYFELKGLTANQAEQLIHIANEVKTTKEKMISSFIQERNTVLAIKNEVETAIVQQQQSLQLSIDRQNQRMQDSLQEVNHSLDESRKQTRQHLEQAATAAKELYTSIQEQLKATLNDMEDQNSRHDLNIKKHSEQLEHNVREKIQDAISSIGSQFVQQKSELQDTLSQQRDETERRCTEIEQSIQQQTSHIGVTEQLLSKQIIRLKWISVGSGTIAAIAFLWLIWAHAAN